MSRSFQYSGSYVAEWQCIGFTLSIYIGGCMYSTLPVGYGIHIFPFPVQTRLATSVTDPITMSPTSMGSPPYGSTV